MRKLIRTFAGPLVAAMFPVSYMTAFTIHNMLWETRKVDINGRQCAVSKSNSGNFKVSYGNLIHNTTLFDRDENGTPDDKSISVFAPRIGLITLSKPVEREDADLYREAVSAYSSVEAINLRELEALE